MFCARCWTKVGAHERSCHECHADLTAPGSVQLADPRRVRMDINGQPIGPATPAPPPAAAPPVPAFDAPAQPPLGSPSAPAAPTPPIKTPRGTGFWAAMKTKALEIGDKARAANQARLAARPAQQLPEQQIAASTGVQVPAGPSVTLPPPGVEPPPPVPDEHQIDTVLRDNDPDRTVIRPPAAPVQPPPPPPAPVAPIPVHGATPVSSATPVRPRDPAPAPALPAPVSDWAAPDATIDDPDRTVIRSSADNTATILQPEDTDRTVLRPPAEADQGRRPRHREENELNLWDDYGIANDQGLRIDRDASRSTQVAQLLGASAIPMAKLLTFVGVLAVTILVLVTLVSQLLTLDSLVVTAPTPTPVQLPPQTTEAAPTAEETGEPLEEPSPAEPVTPSMLPGAKECDPGVWAGPQTSCALANAVGQQVDLTITEPTVIEAFSSSSNRNYRLECTPGEGITCTGLDGVEGVYVWLVTQG